MEYLRKVSKTGGLSYKGNKYYIREKVCRGQVVEVVSKNKDLTLTVKHGESTCTAHHFDMVVIRRSRTTLKSNERIISPQGTFSWKGKEYWVDNFHFQGRFVFVEEIDSDVYVKLQDAPAYRSIALPTE
jgi:hypothetical protein